MDKDLVATKLDIEHIVADILSSIEREREREIIARRYGLYDRKETLEQIGELLNITRERVRQLEKAVMARLKAMADKDLPKIKEFENAVIGHISDIGHVARVSDVASKLTGSNNKIEQSRVSFLAELSPGLSVIDDNDHFFHAIGVRLEHDEKKIREGVASIVDTIKKLNKPVTSETIKEAIGVADKARVDALASISKQLASLNDQWGLVKWPLVNPKNIRDKIYVILRDNGKPMHFSEIAGAIRGSAFKRKDVTTQAIHNELIKDKRFVLIGRGIYALNEWGYNKGTVADIITEVLKDAKEPLHRDEIVKRVLKHRQVKETTILLNLQGKKEFKRVAKATYDLA
jgi:DNA-binding CsgD family transcriptional regulator